MTLSIKEVVEILPAQPESLRDFGAASQHDELKLRICFQMMFRNQKS
jgi:hypothetical protein